jgi:hypothetical protein
VAQLYPRALGSLSSPPTTRRATVEVYDPASARECCILGAPFFYNHFAQTEQTSFPAIPLLLLAYQLPRIVYRAVAYQWTFPLSILFRPSGVVSKYFNPSTLQF